MFLFFFLGGGGGRGGSSFTPPFSLVCLIFVLTIVFLPVFQLGKAISMAKDATASAGKFTEKLVGLLVNHLRTLVRNLPNIKGQLSK